MIDLTYREISLLLALLEEDGREGDETSVALEESIYAKLTLELAEEEEGQ